MVHFLRMGALLKMGVLVGVLALGTLLMGCEALATAGGPEGEAEFPPATTISVRAKSIGMNSAEYLQRYHDVKETAIRTKYTRLIESAPENQKRKYDLLRDQALEFLELNYQERRRQLLEWES